MTTATTASTNSTRTGWQEWMSWIRPWYPAGTVGHLYPDCEHLLAVESEPREGAGWLDPRQGDVCGPCVKRYGIPSWDVICDTCNASMSDEWGDAVALYEDDAQLWKAEHRCEPSVRIIPPTTPNARKAAAA